MYPDSNQIYNGTSKSNVSSSDIILNEKNNTDNDDISNNNNNTVHSNTTGNDNSVIRDINSADVVILNQLGIYTLHYL